MNWEASYLASREVCKGRGVNKGNYEQQMHCFWHGHPPRGHAWKGSVRGLPLVLTREFQVGRLEVTVLRKAEAVIRVGIRFCFADMGP